MSRSRPHSALPSDSPEASLCSGWRPPDAAFGSATVAGALAAAASAASLGLSPPRAGAGRPLRPADRPSDDDDEASDWGSRGHGGGGRPAGRSNVVVVVVVVTAAADVRIAGKLAWEENNTEC